MWQGMWLFHGHLSTVGPWPDLTEGRCFPAYQMESERSPWGWCWGLPSGSWIERRRWKTEAESKPAWPLVPEAPWRVWPCLSTVTSGT